jgi:hypothetical protein
MSTVARLRPLVQRPFVDQSRLGYPEYQALLMLRSVFTVAPVVFGLDKCANVLTDWPRYLGNLLLIPGFYDVALRDAGLLVAALALARLAAAARRRGVARIGRP